MWVVLLPVYGAILLVVSVIIARRDPSPDPVLAANKALPFNHLIVDDDLGIQHALVQALFEECGHGVRTAGDGRAALEILRKGPAPKLISQRSPWDWMPAASPAGPTLRTGWLRG